MTQPADIKADLTQRLKNLHLPTIRQCYEEVARQAEREQLSYERYLHELVQRECDERLEMRALACPAIFCLTASATSPGFRRNT